MPKRNAAGETVSDEQNLATEAASDEIVAEEPKTKVGDKPTTVDGADGTGKKPRLLMPRGNPLFKINDGVDAGKYSGQRGHVIRALQKLAKEQGSDKYFTIDEIDANTEGLVTRVNHKDSVTWHLKGLVATQQATAKAAEEPAKVEAAA